MVYEWVITDVAGGVLVLDLGQAVASLPTFLATAPRPLTEVHFLKLWKALFYCTGKAAAGGGGRVRSVCFGLCCVVSEF